MGAFLSALGLGGGAPQDSSLGSIQPNGSGIITIDTSQGSLGPNATAATLAQTGNLGQVVQPPPKQVKPYGGAPPLLSTTQGTPNVLGLSQPDILNILLGKAPSPGNVMGPGASVQTPSQPSPPTLATLMSRGA